LAVSKLVNPVVKDIVITREEISGLMRGLLDSPEPAAGPTKLTEWATAERETLGVVYANEIGRRIQRGRAYAQVR
jgi:NADH dehydrogenase